MTDITTRLRSIYVAEGANYVQEAADLIECLRAERKALVNDVHSCSHTCVRAGCVNRRLRDALAEAADEIAHWGAYASDYYQKKHDLQACIDAARAALGETK